MMQRYRLCLRGIRCNTTLSINLTQPHLLYPAQAMKREIICHIGPTNSGKTYAALEAMKASKKGVYCGPLRLLAWEVSEKLRSQNISCDLITGQEREVDPEGAAFTACTIEMLDTEIFYDCGIIDEFQLVGDFSRGWAWTRAFLGMQAKQVHLCGSPSMLDIVHKLCAKTGNTVTAIHYERKSPLTVGGDALRNYAHVRKGDCIIGFSRSVLYDIKAQVERQNKHLKCCIIYGNLPPATRKEQAKLFNADASGYDVLVASDAVGMGLNLSIQRIVFSALEKFDGKERRPLFSSEIKQIGGRAGRYNSKFEEGEVICYSARDMLRLQMAMDKPDKAVKKAGISPTREQLEFLGILHDHKVQDEELLAFWGAALQTEWDIAPETALHDAKDHLSIGFILKHFKSTTEFASKLTHFLSSLPGKEHIAEEYDPFKGPRTRLSVLYKMFRTKAELDSNYFVCDLDESAAAAQSIESVPLSFRDRIMFCNAPLMVDDDDFLEYFRTYCVAYANDESVPVGVEVSTRMPKTIDALFRLESLHKVLDLYIWLGHHFPQHFVEIEAAVEMAQRTSLLIHQGIQVIGTLAYRDEKIKRKSQKKSRRR